MSFPPLYCGRLLMALAQVAVVYYAVAVALHCVVPRLLRPPSIQVVPRRDGQAWREACNSLGAVTDTIAAVSFRCCLCCCTLGPQAGCAAHCRCRCKRSRR